MVDFATRFWARVRKGAPDECWPWLGCVHRDGYGKVKLGGLLFYAHRIAYALTHGKIPDGKLVLHSCDNPPCCNPAHLSLGDHDANLRDAVRKRRMWWQRCPPKELEVSA